MEINEQDFKRLNLTTKMIKIVTKIQDQQRNNDETEEWIEEEKPLHGSNNDNPRSNKTSGVQIIDPDNPYAGINLEQVINIDTVFDKTVEGVQVMEALRENPRPNESILKEINKILCECLRSLYGCRPSNFYKNEIALSLVRTYPSLASNNPGVPQALWFHPNARGTNRHAGRLFYHMEYIARKSDERVVKRRRLDEPSNTDAAPGVSSENSENVDLHELILELKTIVPNAQMKSRVLELWGNTFSIRQQHRQQGNFYDFIMDFPVFTAFDGEMVTHDFEKLKPDAESFASSWPTLEAKILDRHKECFKEVKTDFVRAVAITRQKNPSRGSKRTNQDETSRKNPLKGIIEWIEAEDNFTAQHPLLPTLYVRGLFLEDSSDCAICWNNLTIPIIKDLKTAFEVFIKCFYAFNVAPAPSDKQFFLFFGSVLGVETLSTTGTKFMHALS
nr:uncharacterized protein LOC109400596 [Aedes albopictus]